MPIKRTLWRGCIEIFENVFDDVNLVRTVKEREKIGASTDRFIGKETVGDEMIATQ